ncbi:peptidoglycan recognition protein family protein [Oceanobacillus sp. M65]|uniref:peptidoglycan recognition protein family protein n=1 Tax=Oceanobacillus sp. M65 TaxID=3457435 RepID=UPI003FCC7BE3
MNKTTRLLFLLAIFWVVLPLPNIVAEEGTNVEGGSEAGNENQYGIEYGTEVYGEDISKLSEKELQYIPEGWRDGDFESEHPNEVNKSMSYFFRAYYPDVNSYIRNINVASVERQHKDFFTKFNYRNGFGAVEGVVAHETANDNSTITSEISYMSRNHQNAFVHAFVDHERIIQIHPLDLGAWGAGRYGNERFVHVELVRVSNFDQFAKSINNYSDYIANVLYDYNLGVSSAESNGKGSLWSHKAVSNHLGGTNHVDPHGYFERYGYNWAQFTNLVTEKYNNLILSQKANTSKLGKLKSSDVRIYSNPLKKESYNLAGSKYTNSVHYIKAEAKVNNDTFYLISEKPSSTRGTIGWVNSNDIMAYTHKAIDTKKKTFYLKGKGAAYNRAWGGSKNRIYNSAELLKLKYEEFNVHKTETVGANTWYRGILGGQTLWIHSSHLTIKEEKRTSRLGKVKTPDTVISPSEGAPFKAGEEYTDSVFYIKKEKILDGDTYYLISNKPSSTSGTIGWVNSKEITTFTHKAVDTQDKTFYLKGKGAAYNRAWGGSKNRVYNSKELSKLKYEEFNVHKTETVGGNTWYRGTLNGQTLWIHSSHLTTKEEKRTSRLGKVKTSDTVISPDIGDATTSFLAGEEYTGGVFYIKKEMSLDGDTYYLISNKASSTSGTIGWVNAQDITTYTHKAVDTQSKTFYLKGKGAAYNRAWGGSKNRVYNSADLSKLKYEEFNVHKTETVGGNTWYRGTLNEQTLWIHSSHLTTKEEKGTSRLGKVKSTNTVISPDIVDVTTSFEAGEEYTNGVFYIKKEMSLDGNKYYLLSKQPSSTSGTIGWVDEKDITTYTHKAVDSEKKTFYLKGKGAAYNRAWGGSKNKIYNSADLSTLKDHEFKVHKTETVGSNIWYRGKLDGQVLWMHSSHLYN